MPTLSTNLIAKRSGAVTIANEGTTSTAFDARGYATFGLIMPASFTGTSVTFVVSHDNVLYQTLTDSSGNAVALTVAVEKSYKLSDDLAPWRYFKIVAGTSQAAARTLTLMAAAA